MQHSPAVPDTANVRSVHYEEAPQFPGGTRAMRTYLKTNLLYPAAARRAHVSGTVFVNFVINTDGSLTDVTILRGMGFGTDEEALRLVKAMPAWILGRQSGRVVRVQYKLPVVFNLD